MPIGIILTLGEPIIKANGGLLSFVKHFTSCLEGEDIQWLQKARAAPRIDISRVYCVLKNRVWCRVYYGGYSKEETTVWMRSGEERLFPYPHMILAGPLEKAPERIKMQGFQGFRYLHEDLW